MNDNWGWSPRKITTTQNNKTETMKTTKWMMAALIAVTLVGLTISGSGCKEKEATQSGNSTVKYLCGMHPEVVQDKPGKCPKCGMALTEKR